MGLTSLGILSLFVGDDDHAANLCVGGHKFAGSSIVILCGQNQYFVICGCVLQWAAACCATGQMPKRRRTFTTRTGTNKAVALESAATEAATKSAAEGLKHFH